MEVKKNTKFLNGIRVSDKSKDKLNVFDSSNVNSAFNTINNTLKIYHTQIFKYLLFIGEMSIEEFLTNFNMI